MPALGSGPWLEGLLFAVGAAAVWWAGRALAARADVIAERTGLGIDSALVLAVYLGGMALFAAMS